MTTGHEVYYPFYGSILTVIAGGLFALWQSRPKAQTDKFSALVKAYSQLNKEFREDNERLRKENETINSALKEELVKGIALKDTIRSLNEKIAELQRELTSVSRLEAKLAALKKQPGKGV